MGEQNVSKEVNSMLQSILQIDRYFQDCTVIFI